MPKPHALVALRRRYGLLAANGNAMAMFNLGRMHERGEGGPEDAVGARRLYRLAAAQGHADAQFRLGVMHWHAEGGPEDCAETRRLFGLAAAQGDADAQCYLGTMHADGEGGPQDLVEARRLYGLAAAQGHAVAQLNLGTMHANGEGGPRDDDEALRLYDLAAAQGDERAEDAASDLRAALAATDGEDEALASAPDVDDADADEEGAPMSADGLRVAGACVRALQDCNQHPLPPKSYECPVCLDTASESWPHERRWLGLPGCGHVVCSSCALSLANAGNCECPLCRQCWHLPKLQVGSRVTILYNESADDREETPPSSKGLAARSAASASPADGKGGGGGGLPFASREPASDRISFWKRATKLLHRRSGRVEALGDASTRRAVAVRLDEAVGDESEGTGLEVAVVGVPEPHLFIVEDDALSISPSMADALARPTAYSLVQLEALKLLPPALVHCSACEALLPSSAFSNNQLRRQDGRCRACVESRKFAPSPPPLSPPPDPPPAAPPPAAPLPPTSGVEPGAELAEAPSPVDAALVARIAELLGLEEALQEDGAAELIRRANTLCEIDGEGTLQQQTEVALHVITTGAQPPHSPSPLNPSPLPSREATASPAPSSLSFSAPSSLGFTCLGTEKLSKMAMYFFKSDAYMVAQRVAHMALEEAAAAVGGESEKEASARQRGVSLSRNVLAMAADQLAQQGWAETLALNEQLARNVSNVLSAARNVKESAMDAAGAADAQLGDVDLLSRVG